MHTNHMTDLFPCNKQKIKTFTACHLSWTNAFQSRYAYVETTSFVCHPKLQPFRSWRLSMARMLITRFVGHDVLTRVRIWALDLRLSISLHVPCKVIYEMTPSPTFPYVLHFVVGCHGICSEIPVQENASQEVWPTAAHPNATLPQTYVSI